MSDINAYEMEINEVDSDRENYSKYEKYVSDDIFFSFSKTKNLIDIFVVYGYDGTDNNLVGVVELTDEQFEEFIKDNGEEILSPNHFNDYDIEIVKKIQHYFDDGHWLLQLELS